MNAKLLIGVVSSVLAAQAIAADSYTIDPNHTHPSYEIDHFGWSTQRGRFDRVAGKIVLDRDAGTGSIDVAIDPTSISSGVARLDQHLRNEDFFDVDHYPTITFKSTKVTFDGDRPVTVDGELQLLGVARPVTLTITAFHCGPNRFKKDKETCGADAVATVKRSEFGMKYLLPGLADEVKLLINVEAVKD